MVAKKGRPASENPKDFLLRVRLDKETLTQLDKCCDVTGKSRSEVVRDGIKEQYDKTKK